MWDHKYLTRIDLRIIPVLLALMGISLLVISAMTGGEESGFLTHYVKNQIEWFFIGALVFIFFTGLDYHKFNDWSWFLYIGMIVLLLGLYVAQPIQSVHRWYRLPFLGFHMQPSEHAKLIVVMCLGWFLEKKGAAVGKLSSAMQMLVIVGIPFLLILRQPDLGTALVLYPIVLVMGYFAGINKVVLRMLSAGGILALLIVTLLFSGIVSHERLRPFFTSFLHEYQYERLNPKTYHQKAAQTAIAIGGMGGSGWKKSSFAGHKWLPAAHTDSVFAAFGEEFGFLGLLILLFLFYALLYFCFQVVAAAKDHFGRLLSSGIAVYLAMHIIVNIGMMCGFLPISGVPLILVTYGGSSVLTTMAALGILQSIYTRRFMF